MASAVQQVRRLLKAAGTGRLGYEGAVRWATLATRGEDISIVDELTPAPGSTPLTGKDLSALACELAALFAGAGTPVSREEITDAEADALFPPRDAVELDARERTVAAAAHRLAELPDEELYRVLYAGAPAHEAFTGTHTHEHPAYQQGDQGQQATPHTHPHTHLGNADHDHSHG